MKKALIAQSRFRCYMNGKTRKAYGILGDKCSPPYAKVSYHGHRSRKSVEIEIRQAPLTIARLLQTLGREDILFLDQRTMSELGCKPGNKVQVSVPVHHVPCVRNTVRES